MSLDITVVLGAFGGMLAGFYAIARVMLKQAAKDRDAERAERDADRQERKELAKAIQDMAGASGRVADATVKAAVEAETRNGHIAEMVLAGNKVCVKILDKVNKEK